jgi:catechol 2,3-dioxygenase-like lactoylglutathione lyase family enzyme
MPEPEARVDQLNLIVQDMGATLGFYRRLGFSIDEPGEWPPGSGAQHGAVAMPDGFRLEFDNDAMARIWHAGWRDQPGAGGGTVLGVTLPSRDAVDQRYAELTGRVAGAGSRPTTRSGVPATRSSKIPTAVTSG